jgi:hypothetical protein
MKSFAAEAGIQPGGLLSPVVEAKAETDIASNVAGAELRARS